jgi:hypothetical protein
MAVINSVPGRVMAHGRMEMFQTFITSAPVGADWCVARAVSFTLGWVSHRNGTDVSENSKIPFYPCQVSNFDFPALNQVT